MAKDNKLTNIGDSLVIEITPETNGTLLLTSFRDTFRGLDLHIDAEKANSTFNVADGDVLYGSGDANSKFAYDINGGNGEAVLKVRAIKREFRIVEDELFYTDWKPLNEANLKAEEIPQNANIQVRYTRIGNDATGVIEFLRIDLEGEYTAKIVDTPILDASMFSDIAFSDETEAIAKNLFKKLYFRGIVPQYITRAENLDLKEDEDYVSLFYSIAKFFAIIIKFFKRFESFIDDTELMREWIRQKGIYFDESNITLEELQFFAQNLYSEIARRGTKMIFSHKGDKAPSGEMLRMDGEFIRLIRGSKNNELLYENIPLWNVGWCLGCSSPMYRGLNNGDIKLNKTREESADFTSLNNFSYFQRGGGTVSIQSVGEKRVLRLISSSSSSFAGLGRYDTNTNVDDKVYVADPLMDYEICFGFYVNSGSGTLNFQVEGFDALKNVLTDAFIMPNGDSTTNTFLSIPVNKFIANKWYFVRGIIHAYSSESRDETMLNIGYGTNLYFNNSFLRYILPKIYVNGNASVNIWNYKIRPLVRGTNILPLRSGKENSFSLGFIQSGKIFHSYFRNNNNSQSQREITDIIEKYLLPYDVTDILTFINNQE